MLNWLTSFFRNLIKKDGLSVRWSWKFGGPEKEKNKEIKHELD